MELEQNLSRRISHILFALILLLGSSVVIGWVLNVPELYRVVEGFAPMQFNNALCFILIGVGGLLILSDKRAATILMAVLGLILSGLTFIQYPFGVDVGIDLLFFDTDKILHTAHPGRMAPNSALAHILTFSSMLLVATGKVLQVRIAGVLGLSAFAAGLTSLVVYGIDSGGGFDWGSYTKMAVHTSMGFVVSGAAIVLSVAPKLRKWVAEGRIKNFYIWPYLSVLLFGALMIELQLPQDVATGLLYAVVIALTWFGSNKRDFLLVAAVSTVIIIVDISVSTGTFDFSEMVVNRTISVISIWFAAAILYYFKASNEKLIRSQRELAEKNKVIQEAELKFRSIFDNAYQFIGLLEPDGTLIEANQTALDFGGVTIEQARGQNFADSPWFSLSKDIQNQLKDAIKRASNGEFVRYDVDNLGGDGTVIRVDFSLRPIMDNTGKVIYLVPEGRNISDRIELERKLTESEEEFRTIFETIDEGIVYQNKDGSITNANAAAERILGLSLDQMTGRKSIDPRWKALREDGSDFPGEEHPAMMALKTGREQRNVIQGIFHPGKEDYVWITANSYPVFDKETKEVKQVYSTFEDITDEYLAKKALEDYARKLSEKNKELEEFTYVASHDLQEPIRTISSFVELLKEGYSEQLDEDARQYLEFMQGASERSQQLIVDLLDYSRIGKKKELETIDLNNLLNDVLEDLTVKVRNTHAKVNTAELPTLLGFRTDLRLLFQNLISNGIKFSKPNVKPELTVSVKENPSNYEFTVSDNGIGIDEKYFDKIFVIFRRLHGRSDYEGTGIGLAHCKKIVELHQGKIWVESEVDKGTRFHFTLSKKLNVQ